MIYLDNNSTTRPMPGMLAALRAETEMNYFNPSSTHDGGLNIQEDIATKKKEILTYFGLSGYDIIFTSGASEANGILAQSYDARYFSAMEHSSVYDAHATQKYSVKNKHMFLIKNDSDGQLIASSIDNREYGPSLVSVMYANNETGHIINHDEIVAIKKKMAIRIHVDFVAGLAKDKVPDLSYADFITISGHKIHALKGIGAILFKTEYLEELMPLFTGGPQELGVRPGTQNTLGISSLHHVLCKVSAPDTYEIKRLRDKLEDGLRDVSEINLGENRVSNTSNLYFPHIIDNQLFLRMLSEQGIYASAGSACSSGLSSPSRVLEAIYGTSSHRATNSVRFSLSRFTTEEEIYIATSIILDVVKEG